MSARERTLALAGVVQATELVRQAAWHGTWSGFAATASLQSLFRMEADNAAEVYGGKKNLHLGLETLVSTLQGEQRYADALRYSVSLLQLERKFMKSSRLQDQIGHALKDISQQDTDLDQHEREDSQARSISKLYTETVSQLSPRIVVNGRPQYLKNDRTVSWVRTLLMAGLRSAVLWEQLGGGRFELLFKRKNIMREAQALLYN